MLESASSLVLVLAFGGVCTGMCVTVLHVPLPVLQCLNIITFCVVVLVLVAHSFTLRVCQVAAVETG